MREVLLVIMIFLASNLLAQDNYNEFFKRKSDSIIISVVGIDNFENYFEFQNFSYYQYSNRKGKLSIASYDDKLKKKISIREYYFRYLLRIDSLDYQHLLGFKITSENLNTFESQISDIPKYLIEREKCNIIVKNKAIEIAVKNNLTNIDSNWIANLNYNSDIGKFLWTVIGTTEILSLKPHYSSIVNEIRINAVTKKVISIKRKERLDQIH